MKTDFSRFCEEKTLTPHIRAAASVACGCPGNWRLCPCHGVGRALGSGLNLSPQVTRLA